MAVRIDSIYEGDLHCTVVHAPSGNRFTTDAPTDNRGKGEFISPTDLVAAAIGACALTIMGIAARARNLDIAGARASVTKEMGASPRRHIARLTAEFTLPAHLAPADRDVMERAARTCPVQASLADRTELVLSFRYV